MTSVIGRLLRPQNAARVSYSPARAVLPGLALRSDKESQLRAMGTVGTLFAIVNRSSNAVAQTEWCLYRTRDGRGRIAGEEPRRRVEDHLALRVLDSPNPFMSRQRLFEMTQQHVDLTGEGWWLVVRPNPASPPLELWPLRPDRVEPVPHPVDFLAGYVYHGPDGSKTPLDVSDVLAFQMPNPLDPYRGMGPVQSILADLDSSRYSAEWNRSFFLNSAEPGGIIQSDRDLDDDEFREFQARWREQHQGVAQSHRVALIEKGMTWVDRKFTQRDMQFEQLRNLSRDVIREAFGISKTMLGQTEDVNRATAEAAEYVFSRWFLADRLRRIEGVLNTQYLPMFGATGQGVEFEYMDPTPESAEQVNADRDSRTQAAATLVSAGYDPADALECVGLPPMRYVGTESATTPELTPVTSSNGSNPGYAEVET